MPDFSTNFQIAMPVSSEVIKVSVLREAIIKIDRIMSELAEIVELRDGALWIGGVNTGVNFNDLLATRVIDAKTGEAKRIWSGTREEYDALSLTEQQDDDVIYIVR